MESKASFVLQRDNIADVSLLFSWTTSKGGDVYMRSTAKGSQAIFVQRSITSPSTGLCYWEAGSLGIHLFLLLIPSASNGASDRSFLCVQGMSDQGKGKEGK